MSWIVPHARDLWRASPGWLAGPAARLAGRLPRGSTTRSSRPSAAGSGAAAAVARAWLALPGLWVRSNGCAACCSPASPGTSRPMPWTDVPGRAAARGLDRRRAGSRSWCVWRARGLARGRRRRPLAAAAVGLLLAAAPPGAGRALGLRESAGRRCATRAVRPARRCWPAGAIVQPNIPEPVVLRPGAVAADYRRLIALSTEACQPGDAGALAGERRLAVLLRPATRSSEADLAALSRAGCSVLLNSTPKTAQVDATFNSASCSRGGDGPTRYDKRHLVPFGEYVPLAEALLLHRKLARNAGDFSPAAASCRCCSTGSGSGSGRPSATRSSSPSEVAELTRAGATVLVSMTNDAWYGDTAAPWQHLRAARFRAAENRRPLLRAAITGVSAVIAPDGSAARRGSGVSESGLLPALGSRGGRDLTPVRARALAVPGALPGDPRRRRSAASGRWRARNSTSSSARISSSASCSPPNCSSASTPRAKSSQRSGGIFEEAGVEERAEGHRPADGDAGFLGQADRVGRPDAEAPAASSEASRTLNPLRSDAEELATWQRAPRLYGRGRPGRAHSSSSGSTGEARASSTWSSSSPARTTTRTP